MSKPSPHRLPREVLPRHYRLTFEPDLDAAAFRGTAVIDVTLRVPTAEVVLNAVELDIGAVAAVGPGGEHRDAATIARDDAAERVTFAFSEPLEAGDWTLEIGFAGILNDDLRGFYRSTYTAADGAEKVIATTQLESTDARRAFPCWDEPDIKATFGITLVVDEGLSAVSNARIVSEEPVGEGKRAVRFADTMIMPTYLVALIVGELEATDPVDVSGVPLRVLHVPGKAHLSGFALDIGAFALEYFTEYYGIPYPGDKLDMIAIPDFSYGAMENLGAITYRETALLVDPETSTQAERARIADVVAHEIAHMWFGDLVTMKWWNGVWLNEAFASFMETKCVEAYRPDWKRWLAFAGERAHAMDLDALASTRPIEFHVESPSEANEMFDSLTYAKGQAVLRMLEVYLGEEVFRSGIATYLAAHAYANTETADLWHALEAVSGEPVGDIMQAWITRGGFPRLTVAGDGDAYRIEQEQFRYRGHGTGRWKVPVLYDSGDGPSRVLVSADVTRLEAGPGVLLNRRGQGFYRVRYDADLFDGVVSRLADLVADERYAFVSDAWANVLAGNLDGLSFISLCRRLDNELEPAVWESALGGLSELDRVVAPAARPWLQGVVRDLVGPLADRLRWEPGPGESDLDRRLRGRLISARGVLGRDEETVKLASDVFEAWLVRRDAVDGEVGAAAVGVVAATGGAAEFERFVELYHHAASPQDEVRFLRAAVSVPDPDAAARALEMVLDGTVRRQDSPWVLAGLIGHRDTGPATWELVKHRWDEVIATPPPQTVRRVIDYVPYRSEPEVAADIEAWLQDHPLPGVTKYAAQQIERMRVRVGLREREATRLGPGVSSS